jgi:hypothetical protein
MREPSDTYWIYSKYHFPRKYYSGKLKEEALERFMRKWEIITIRKIRIAFGGALLRAR